LTRLETNFLIPIEIIYKEPKKEETKKEETKADKAAAGTAGNATDTAGNATATAADVKAADSTTDAKAADDTAADATAADGTAATDADSTTKEASTAAATETDKATAKKDDKPKERIPKSGGQLAGIDLNVDSGSKAKKEKKKEAPPPPPDSLPITEQVTLQASPTAKPKETILPLKNPESTASPEKEVAAAKAMLFANLGKISNKRKNRKNRKNNKGKKTAAGTTSEPEEVVEEEPTVDEGPMKVKTGDMDASGGLPINSNQKTVPLGITGSTDPKTGRRRMFVTNFFDHPVTGKRQLLGVSELDVQRDVVDLTFITETDQETNPIGYYLDMEKWDENGIGIKVNYTDPLMVGKGNDQVMTTLKNPGLFISASSGEALPKEDATTIKFSPTQVPKDVSEDKLNADAKQTNNAMLALIILQIVAQISLKGGMDDLWSMFFTLQIVCYLKFYGVIVPTNVTVYRDQFVNLVEFNVFNPQKAV